MHSGDRTSILRRDRRDDAGFTLVEVLIVIVILGVLATVTVFAVRGITNNGQENSEAQELRIVRTATESYTLLNGTVPGSAQDLVDAGLLDEAPGLWTYSDNGDGTYSLTNIRTGDVATSAGNAGADGGTAWSGAPTSVAGVPAVSVSSGGGANQIVWFGGEQTRAAWNAAVDAGRDLQPSGMAGGETYFMIDIADVADLTALEAVLDQVHNGPVAYSWVVPEDDVPAFCDNFDSIPVSFSVCAEIAALNVGAAQPDNVVSTWFVADIDGLFEQ